MKKQIFIGLTGIFWVAVTIEPTIFIGLAVVLTLNTLDLIIHD
jgi:hypothetical protein